MGPYRMIRIGIVFFTLLSRTNQVLADDLLNELEDLLVSTASSPPTLSSTLSSSPSYKPSSSPSSIPSVTPSNVPSISSIPSNVPSFVPTLERVDATTLDQKIMVGYQGWFMTTNDGGLNEWRHWTRNGVTPSKEEIRVAMWPDLREYEREELEPTQLFYNGVRNAGLFSSYNEKTVLRHLRWMREYDIDGAFVQRFLVEAIEMRSVRDKVLANVRLGAEIHGRVFANMYDISGYGGQNLVQDLKADWMHLVDNELITESPSYLHHNGLPVVSIWGFGFSNRPGTAAEALELLRWFKSPLTPRKYRATLMGGVRNLWRQETNEWDQVYRSFDIISPWTVGRMKNLNDVTTHRFNNWEPDLALCKLLGIDYLPVVYPGYSFHNSKDDKVFNEVPRLGGNFFWRQMRAAIDAGANMVYVAMFDEVDEGTAVFKVAENSQQAPVGADFVNLNTDQSLGFECVPSDWYMSLIGNATMLLREGKPLPNLMPSLPTSCPADVESMTTIEFIFSVITDIVSNGIGSVLGFIPSLRPASFFSNVFGGSSFFS